MEFAIAIALLVILPMTKLGKRGMSVDEDA